MQDLGNAWCAFVELCAVEDVLLCLNLRVQRLEAIEFDKESLGIHTASVVRVPAVHTLVFATSADDSSLKVS